jgi:hypothetical protein
MNFHYNYLIYLKKMFQSLIIVKMSMIGAICTSLQNYKLRENLRLFRI